MMPVPMRFSVVQRVTGLARPPLRTMRSGCTSAEHRKAVFRARRPRWSGRPPRTLPASRNLAPHRRAARPPPLPCPCSLRKRQDVHAPRARACRPWRTRRTGRSPRQRQPNSYGSSATGVKKSSVSTAALSLSHLPNTAASSARVEAQQQRLRNRGIGRGRDGSRKMLGEVSRTPFGRSTAACSVRRGQAYAIAVAHCAVRRVVRAHARSFLMGSGWYHCQYSIVARWYA